MEAFPEMIVIRSAFDRGLVTTRRSPTRRLQTVVEPGVAAVVQVSIRSLQAGLCLLGLVVGAASAEVPYVNWENHPVHPLDLCPDGSTLAIAHTADHRVVLYDVAAGFPVALGHVAVGLDPVSVRFRNDTTLWVANHVSDTVSVIDIPSRSVIAILGTADEPYDIVFAGQPQRAFVSCSQANLVQMFDPAAPLNAPVAVAIDGEDPRALAVSRDGRSVYVAIFESGNATTILAGGTGAGGFPANVVRDPATPYAGQSPPPNAGSGFSPALAAGLPPPPRSGLIVRKSGDGRWLDVNQRDWTPWVSGASAAASNRVPGWDLPDHDLAQIDTATLAVSYVSGLMNIGMALAVHPVSGRVTLVGTDARNEVRFEPNLRGRFIRVNLASAGTGSAPVVIDLNPHLDYASATLDAALRERSIGDPRALVWSADGTRGFVAGMGSNNVVVLTANGARDPALAPIVVGEGPAGLALDEAHQLLYVWNHFEASLSLVDTLTLREVERVRLHSPLPAAIRQGRRFLYDTHLSSGTGHTACASCHVDARIDRLAWDLGDPSGSVKAFNQNCLNDGVGAPCTDFHPMKGPMTTLTLQDIIGKEPLHWRGDRDGIEAFGRTFVALQGRADPIDAAQMQAFEDFLSSIAYAPNPNRPADNSLPTALALPGHVSAGRFSTIGTPLPVGNAQRGLQRFQSGMLDLLTGQGSATDNCAVCHSLPTGFGINGTIFAAGVGFPIGGRTQPIGPAGENHLGILSAGTVSNGTFKVPSLRNLHERTGFELATTRSRSGFGFIHDGTVDTLARFLSLEEFATRSDQDLADLIAFLVAFSGSDLPGTNPQHSAASVASKDTHAGVGRQVRAANGDALAVAPLVALTSSQRVDLIARVPGTDYAQGWLYRPASSRFEPDDGGATLDLAALLARAAPGTATSLTVVPGGLGERLALDRDGDGARDGVEIARGALPYDARSVALRPGQGLWYNPARSGHGLDVQFAGETLAVTWYTYATDGTPTWYLAVAAFAGNSWSADLQRYALPAAGQSPVGSSAGSITLAFADAEHAELRWTIDGAAGSEPIERFRFGPRTRSALHTGLWFDPADSGWGLSLDSQGGVTTVVVYFYDGDGAPRWVLGVLGADGQVVPQFSYRGFCPGCTAITPIQGAGGDVRLTTGRNRRIRVEVAVLDSAMPAAVWRRTTTIVPLTSVPADPYAQ